MVKPGLLAVVAPVAVGFLGGAEMLGGLLAGVTVTGVLLALFQSNAGGAWDNAKKMIEEGYEVNGVMLKKSESVPTGNPYGESLRGIPTGHQGALPFKKVDPPIIHEICAKWWSALPPLCFRAGEYFLPKVLNQASGAVASASKIGFFQIGTVVLIRRRYSRQISKASALCGV